MAKITNTFSLNITATEDSSQNVPINRSVTNSFDSSIADYVAYAVVPLAGLFPQINIVVPCVQLYVRNLDPAKSIVVAWTPNGGAFNTAIELNPGDFIAFCCNPAGTTPGITNLSFTPSANGALVEYFIGA